MCDQPWSSLKINWRRAAPHFQYTKAIWGFSSFVWYGASVYIQPYFACNYNIISIVCVANSIKFIHNLFGIEQFFFPRGEYKSNVNNNNKDDVWISHRLFSTVCVCVCILSIFLNKYSGLCLQLLRCDQHLFNFCCCWWIFMDLLSLSI